jgi:hypothetical protein
MTTIKSTKHFITFAGGEQNYYDATKRLQTQAQNINLFDTTKIYTDQDLKNDSEFWPRHSEFITTHSRGYGYWVWKSYIIKKTMETLQDGDVLLYLDCGCEIGHHQYDALKKNLEEGAKEDYILRSLHGDENTHTKMDLFIKMGMLEDKYVYDYQYQSGAFIIYVCDKTREFINEWYDLSCDYSNIDDSPSIHPNLPCFVEHRHDQSIFSLLTKKYELPYNHRVVQGVEYIRNRTGHSVL